MANVTLIYAYWPNQPQGVTWCDLPWAVRDAGLPAELASAGHEVVESMLMSEAAFPEELPSGFDLAREIAEQVREARSNGDFPVVLCGSCSIAAIGTVAGLGAGTGIAWFDAHPDLMTPETTTSGLFEGMALSCATGTAWRTLAVDYAGLVPTRLEDVVLIGARDIDPSEAAIIEREAIPVVHNDGHQVAERLSGAAQTYIHLDMDVHDPAAVRANGFTAPNGLRAGDVRDLIEACPRIGALAITGLDPAASEGKTAAQVAIAHVLVATHAWANSESETS